MKEKQRRKVNIRKIISVLVILVLIPLTVYFGFKYADRQYYVVSLVIILMTMIPFFLAFEHRKPQARELVIIAVMCAIAIVSRAAFIALPGFKPMTSIIMLTGIAFGAEAGFMTGAITAFVSNFIFSQGPWTPWQMFAYGMAGFLAGILYKHGFLSTKRLPLSIYGAAMVLIVIGPLLDTSSVFTMITDVTMDSALAVYMSGLGINAVHAAATFVTLFLLSKFILEKLERIKTKYGILES